MTPLSYKTRLGASELDTLANFAIIKGYKRFDPTKKWTIKEKKEAARFTIDRMLSECLYPEQKNYIQREVESLV